MKSKKYPSVAESIIMVAARLENIANHFVFNPAGITSASIKILGALCRSKDLTPGEILEKVGGTKSNISQRLNYLEKEGLIERKYGRVKTDKRRASVRLTPRGKKKLLDLGKKMEHAQASLKESFSEDELKQHFAFIEKLTGLLSADNKELEKLFDK